MSSYRRTYGRVFGSETSVKTVNQQETKSVTTQPEKKKKETRRLKEGYESERIKKSVDIFQTKDIRSRVSCVTKTKTLTWD